MLACKIVCAPGLIGECSHLEVALQVPLARVLYSAEIVFMSVDISYHYLSILVMQQCVNNTCNGIPSAGHMQQDLLCSIIEPTGYSHLHML